MQKINFASDNYAGIHEEVLAAIHLANVGPMKAYGEDEFTELAQQEFQKQFGRHAQAYFVCNGTAANVLGLSHIIRSHQAIICSDLSHLQVDECGAFEKHSGSKFMLTPHQQGKISVNQIKTHLLRINDQHSSQPRVISITQSTEYGTVYSIKEIKALSDFAHQHHLLLHMDGARIANAATTLDSELIDLTSNAGVDILSFGGTKNGLMLGEAVIFFDSELAQQFQFTRKQGMQLLSKMRFVSAQFIALFKNNLWLNNAKLANRMALRLAKHLQSFKSIQITQNVESNAVFAIMPSDLINHLQKQFYFYIWNAARSEVRLMTSYNTTEEEVDAFAQAIIKYS